MPAHIIEPVLKSVAPGEAKEMVVPEVLITRIGSTSSLSSGGVEPAEPPAGWRSSAGGL